MKNLILVILAFTVLAFSGCTTSGERKAGETLRNIHNLTLAVKKPEANVNPQEALAVIERVTSPDSALKFIDPKEEGPASVSVADIIADKPAALKKIVIDASTTPPSDWGWLATLGGGLLIAAGFAGKFMGPPWNIGGAIAEGLGRRLVPKYDETKQAAIGMLVATDTALTNYGDLLDTLPEVKKLLTEKLGRDPVEWFKSQLQKAHTDQGTEPAVQAMLLLAKQQMTTEDGVLTPGVAELDKFIARGISSLK